MPTAGEPWAVEAVAGVPLNRSAVLCLAFFLSGAAGLVFETLWFRQAGLMLGNSVWASSLVMGAFMAGLATGNTWAVWRGSRVGNPLIVYAVLELLVGATGLALVLLFPHLTRALAPLLGTLADTTPLLNLTRIAVAFPLLLLPSAAMGATLPLLVRALAARRAGFGRALGRLYGWNTLGAVAGALGGEALLLPGLGLRGAGLAAAALNALAACSVAAVSRSTPSVATEEGSTAPSSGRSGLAPGARRLLAASFLGGGILLALEVVWFRFLLLFFFSSSLAFAAMLAVVLLGIGLGGLIASWWLKVQPGAARYLSLLALGAGIAGVLTYAGFARVLDPLPPGHGLVTEPGRMLAWSLALMLPVSIASGGLFTLAGEALRTEVVDPTRAAGLLTLANTVGAALGALAGGLVLLPGIGLERSLFALCLGYAAVALLVGRGPSRGVAISGEPRLWLVLGLGASCFALVLAQFPFGLMRNHYLKYVVARWTGETSRVVAYREGLTETIFYVRRELLGQPLNWRLATNGFSMSDTSLLGQRYMRLFVHWPMALRPDARKALLISFGVGSTAKALTDTPWLERIDVVDTSRDILEMGRAIFPRGGYPLDDPRVRVHVEDGRFFLLAARERYDLVTAEPPPPKNAGIVNLYTREYFQLIHDRLAERGVATYWLPVYQMPPVEARSITAAFCEVFRDCSLWTGSGLEWMLAGTRGLRGPVDEGGLARQWADPVLARALRDIGVEVPEQLGALFIADASALAEWTRGAPPLDDDHPSRLSSRYHELGDREYPDMMEGARARRRFEDSAFIREVWPAAMRARTLELLAAQKVINDALSVPYVPGASPPGIEALEYLLSRTSLRAPVLWLMGDSLDQQRVADEALAEGVREPQLDEILGHRAMAERDYRRAEELLAHAQPYAGHADQILRWRILALLLAGDRARAADLLRGRGTPPADRPAERDWSWLAERMGSAKAGPGS